MKPVLTQADQERISNILGSNMIKLKTPIAFGPVTAQTLAAALPPLSHLECDECGRHESIGDVSEHLKAGWPECCGSTMRLVAKEV